MAEANVEPGSGGHEAQGPPGRRLVLASRSPQRRAILEQVGVAFEVCPAGVEEVHGGQPAQVAAINARRKAEAVAAAAAPGDAVLGADTVVALGGRILPKPHDAAEAERGLRALSGRTHQVLGGLCVVAGNGRREALVSTDVRFRGLTDTEIDWYLASEEWRDRAGGYAIQGRGGALVASVEGDYLNVVGLSLQALFELVPGLLPPC